MVKYEPTAAERYDGDEPCAYGDCDEEADFVVEINRQATMKCCRSCGRKNRLHPEDVLDKEIVSESEPRNARSLHTDTDR